MNLFGAPSGIPVLAYDTPILGEDESGNKLQLIKVTSGNHISIGAGVYIEPGEYIEHALPSVAAGSVKNTTGDPGTPEEGQLTINTFDGAVKIFADGSWRTLVSW